MMTPWITAIAEILPPLATGAFFCLLGIQLIRYFGLAPYLPTGGAFFGEGNELAPPAKAPWLWLLLIFLLSRALIYTIALAFAFIQGAEVNYLQNPLAYFVRWDANHYMGIAENWYVNEGDPRFHIVFFPLYPLIVRLINPLFFGNTRLAGLFVSNASFYASGAVLYKLMRLTHDEGMARRAVRYLMFFPLSFFFSLPFSESVFLLTTLLCVYLARRRKFALAILMGVLATFSRLLGAVVCAPLFYEFLRDYKKKGVRAPGRILVAILLTSLILIGFLAYLLINHQVTGDLFKFMEYEKTHWSQSFGSLYNTLSYSIENAFTYPALEFRYSIWFPQSIFILLTLALLTKTARRLDPAHAAYALIYLYIASAPTWLLSGTRYLMAMYAIYPALALITIKKWQDILLSTAFAAASCYFIYFYAFKGCLY